MTRRSSLFQMILAATATPDTIDGAVMTAVCLARHQQARLKIVHAVPLLTATGHDNPSFVALMPEAKAEESKSKAVARGILSLYSEIFPALQTTDILIAPGTAWEAVFRSAVDLACDLIVLGPHCESAQAKRMPKSGRFIGSTADGVIRQVPCPVLIANRAFDNRQLRFAKIVVGIDFSASCASAIILAALIAKRFGGDVAAFHMLPIPPYPKYTPQAIQADRLRLHKRMNTICSLLLEGIGHQFYLKPGARPQEEVLRFAKKVGADLIIMGSHTKEKSGKWYAGSVVQQVACHSQCPVIVVSGVDSLSPWKNVPFIFDRYSMVEPHLSHFPS